MKRREENREKENRFIRILMYLSIERDLDLSYIMANTEFPLADLRENRGFQKPNNTFTLIMNKAVILRVLLLRDFVSTNRDVRSQVSAFRHFESRNASLPTIEPCLKRILTKKR